MPEPANKDKVKVLSSNQFPVIGVGASAGGLEAFKRLIRAIPEDSGMAYILVQHLEPTHESILADILQKITSIPIHEIANNVHVEPNHIYIIPSNKLLTATDGVLQLSPRPPRNEKNMPIDLFFTSLAEVHQSHAIGVVLSGLATDGTLGLKAIKDHGGITFAQDRQSAGFDGMPQSAIDADVVDFILTPEEIPAQLAALNQATKNDLVTDGDDVHVRKEDIFRQLLSLLRVRRGADFTYYKQATIRRRIIRRMGLNKIEDITDYLSYVKEHPAELDNLYQDLLISFTDFFRDPKIFDALYDTLFPLLDKDREDTDPFRIWVAGCSTGEEPYSLAICLHEYMGEKTGQIKIQIFATDISEKAISKARTGIYTKREVANLSSNRLQKYFTKINGNFQLIKPIREMCVFACHNFLKDPPFAKMDLISCRNVLIYMEPFLQKKALTTFHYALKEKGYLLLGRSETTGPAADLFNSFDVKSKLYAKKMVPGKFLNLVADRNENVFANKKLSPGMDTSLQDFQKSADAILLAEYAPPGVVVNEQLDIVQFRGATGAWLEPSPGKPSLNLLKMAREGLAFELRNAIHKVKESNKALVKERIPIQSAGKQQIVTIKVIPLPHTTEPYYLIVFTDTALSVVTPGPDDTNIPRSKIRQSAESALVQRLTEELTQVREDMRSITEDQESINEELQSTNEELLSGGEELQSLNEELETSKEEIQSTNEELTTLIQELFDRNEQLDMSRLYAESIVATIREPLVILDKNWKVKTANRSYYDKFGTTGDKTEGKLFYDLENGQWNIPALRSMLDKLATEERKVTGFEITQTFKDIGERTMLLNASRIFGTKTTEQLILLAIEDISDAKKIDIDRRRFTFELEKQVAERTLALKETNISLEQSNENLEQFATIASHDLQEPLRKIRTFASILKLRHSQDIPGTTKELLQKINLSAERMSTLIKDVLNFSKIQSSGSAYIKTDLDEIVKQVIADFDLLSAQQKTVIQCDPLPVIEAIPLQINQLFFNLISNALKFSKNISLPVITITVSMLSPDVIGKFPALTDKKSYCEIIFQDNGVGFNQQYAKQIFLIFQRLNPREKYDGTGIGLALCKKIVNNHHGEIFAESKEGEWTRFHVILPMRQSYP